MHSSLGILKASCLNCKWFWKLNSFAWWNALFLVVSNVLVQEATSSILLAWTSNGAGRRSSGQTARPMLRQPMGSGPLMWKTDPLPSVLCALGERRERERNWSGMRDVCLFSFTQCSSLMKWAKGKWFSHKNTHTHTVKITLAHMPHSCVRIHPHTYKTGSKGVGLLSSHVPRRGSGHDWQDTVWRHCRGMFSYQRSVPLKEISAMAWESKEQHLIESKVHRDYIAVEQRRGKAIFSHYDANVSHWTKYARSYISFMCRIDCCGSPWELHSRSHPKHA